MLFFVLVQLAALCLTINGKPVNDSTYKGDLSLEDPEMFEYFENPERFEFDDILPRNRVRRTASRTGGWPSGVVPYEVEKDENGWHKFIRPRRHELGIAMLRISQETCVIFRPKVASDESYIKFFDSKVCGTYVGRTLGMNPVYLNQRKCFGTGSLYHELLHVLGFFHEHQRPGRDDYLDVYEGNIDPIKKKQYEKLDPDELRLVDGFDYDSVMLYGDDTFSKEPGLKTMIAKLDGVTLKPPYDKSLSSSDIFRINYMYRCFKM